MNRPPFFAFLVASLAAIPAVILALPGAARAESFEPPPDAPADAPPPAVSPAPVPDAPVPVLPAKPSRFPEITTAIGLRAAGLPSAGFDPYATSDFLGQLSLSAGPTFLKRGKVSLAALAEWDVGSAHGTARGDTAALTLHRLAVALEARYQAAYRLGLFVKLAPGAYHLRGSIEDPGFPRSLVARSWTYSLDATGGVAFLFATVGTRADPDVRFWFTGEVGYAFAGTSAMNFTPEEDAGDSRHYGSLSLPSFTPSGAIGRLAFAVSF